jgi:hypothetical protein
MADQGWVDQANLLTAWDNNNSPRAWVDQANLLTAWDNNNSPYAWVDQANLLVVWDEFISTEMIDRTDTLLRLNGAVPETIDVDTDSLFGQTLELTAGEILAEGDILVLYDDSGITKVRKANAATAGRQDSIAIAMADAAADAIVSVRMLPGTVVSVSFSLAPITSDNGSPVYLSTTNGKASVTPPAGSGDAIIRIGILYGASGSDTTPEVIFRPQFITDIA